MISNASRQYIEQLRQTPAFGTNGFDLEGLRSGMATKRPPTIAAHCINADVDGISSEWVTTDGADPNTRMLYLHGGGYVSGSGANYLAMAAHISAAAGCVVLLPDYRLAPEHPFPAGLEDCVRAHEWLTTNGPDGPGPATATIIGGDSAGGGLTLASLLALRDRGSVLPKGGIALSAFADLTLTASSIQSEAAHDPIMSPRCLPEFATCYLGTADARTPLASPVFGDYSGIPPLLLQVGEHEIIRDDSVKAAEKAKADGVDVTLEVWEGMFHVFPSHEPLLPEACDALAHIADFIRRVTAC